MNHDNQQIFFAPLLYIETGMTDIDFYINGLGATEVKRWANADGSIHAAELSIEGNIFHLHEESPSKMHFEPLKNKGTTVMIGLFVPDVDVFMKRAIEAGAVEILPPQDYDYGYRQGEIMDPFGHIWVIEKRL